MEISNAGRIVFPEIGKTKRDVVAYYERIAERALPHVAGRPLSIRRYPKGLAGPGFFQKNVPPHYPESIQRFAVPRSRAATKKHRSPSARDQDATNYPIVSEPEHLAYLANQGAIELHVPNARIPDLDRPDRIVIDLDPPPGAFAQAQRAAQLTRDALAEFGLHSTPMATGSKGYHVVAPIQPLLDVDELALAVQQFAALLAAKHPEELTTVFRVALRGSRVFIDWLRVGPIASVVAPYSLRATARASVAAPLAWSELDSTPPDAYTLLDIERLLDRPDTLAATSRTPNEPGAFTAAVGAAFERSGLVLEPFDRFRS